MAGDGACAGTQCVDDGAGATTVEAVSIIAALAGGHQVEQRRAAGEREAGTGRERGSRPPASAREGDRLQT